MDAVGTDTGNRAHGLRARQGGTGSRNHSHLHGDSPERSVAPMTGVLERYQQLIIAEELRTDTDQQAAAQRLDALQKELEAAPPRGSKIGRAHVCTPVTNAHLVSRLL